MTTHVVMLNPTPVDGKRLAVYFWSLLGSPAQFGTEGALERWANELLPILKSYPYADVRAALKWAIKETDDDFWRNTLFLPRNVVKSIDTVIEQWWIAAQRQEAISEKVPYDGPSELHEFDSIREYRRALDKEYELQSCIYWDDAIKAFNYDLPMFPPGMTDEQVSDFIKAHRPCVYKLRRDGSAITNKPCARCGCFIIPRSSKTDEELKAKAKGWPAEQYFWEQEKAATAKIRSAASPQDVGERVSE